MQFLWPEHYLNFVEALQNMPALSAMAIGGSHSIGKASKNSDIDLFIVTRAVDLNGLESWITDVGCHLLQTVFHIKRGFVEDMGYMHQLLMLDGSLLDITIIVEEEWERFNIRPTMLVLYDRNGQFEKIVAESSSPDEKIKEQKKELEVQYIGRFFVEMWTAFNLVKRHDFWRAIFAIERARSAVFCLFRFEIEQYPAFLRRPEDHFETILTTDLAEVLKSYNLAANRQSVLSSGICLMIFYLKFTTNSEHKVKSMAQQLHGLFVQELGAKNSSRTKQ